MKTLRLGGPSYVTSGKLQDGSLVDVMYGEGKYVSPAGQVMEYIDHDGGLAVFKPIGQALASELNNQQREFIGLDPDIPVPVRSYFVFGSGSHDVEVRGSLPDKPLIDFGDNGFWGEKGIMVRLSEIPAATSVETVSYPGGRHTIIRAIS